MLVCLTSFQERQDKTGLKRHSEQDIATFSIRTWRDKTAHKHLVFTMARRCQVYRFMLTLQLPVAGSCSILKLSNDIPNAPKIELPKSLSFPKASSFIFCIFSSCNFSRRFLKTGNVYHLSMYQSQNTKVILTLWRQF